MSTPKINRWILEHALGACAFNMPLLATRSGFTERKIEDWLAGKAAPSLPELERLLDVVDEERPEP
ncbi:MAG TPA: hypothetical protein VN929_19605 [Burkholderiales bacterium]|nr:hypothetical protein [Burkholderiales bacterium]